MWNISGFRPKCVLHCKSELPPTFSQLPSTVTNHCALNTTFAHLFFNIFKTIQGFKSNSTVTPPKTFSSLLSRRTILNALTKLDLKLFQGRAENIKIT